MALGERSRTLHRDEVAGLGAVRPAVDAVRYAPGLASRIRRLRPDLVHTISLKSALYGGTAARLARVPVVWSIQDRIALDYLPASVVKMVRAASRVVPTAIIANSAATDVDPAAVGGPASTSCTRRCRCSRRRRRARRRPSGSAWSVA